MSGLQRIKTFSIHVLLFMLISSLIQSASSADEHQAYFGVTVPVRADAEYLRSKNGFLAEWAEFEIEVSAPGTIKGIRVIKGSGNTYFESLQMQQMKKLERFVRVDPEATDNASTKFIKRLDFFMIEQNSPYFAQVIHPHIELTSSNKAQAIDATAKSHLLFVNSTQNLEPGKEYFEVIEPEHEGPYKVLQINLQSDQPIKKSLADLSAQAYEQLSNKHLISYHEFVMAIRAYEHHSPGIVSKNGTIYNEKVFNQSAAFIDKTEYWFKRPMSSRPVLDAKTLFGNYLGELTLEGYEGNMIVSAVVLPSGKLVNIQLINPSEVSRLNEMVIQALSHKYVTPAFLNHQPVADEIVFELSFSRQGAR
jgi:hypothetical protein